MSLTTTPRPRTDVPAARPEGGPDADPGALLDVAVIGGGIGGLASALALARAGRSVRVLERAPEFGEVGAGLQMAPNATRVLRSWGLLDEVIARGVVPRRLVMRDAVDGTELTHVDLRDAQARYGAPYVVIHRSDLHEILLDACRDAGVGLVTSATVSDVHDSAAGQAGATAIRDGAHEEASVVLAADGLGSRLRRRLSADAPVSSHYVAYRGAVPLESIPDTSEIALDDVTVFVGPQCHLVQYSLRGGAMVNQVAVFASPRALAGQDDWGTPDELDGAFARTCDTVRKALPHLSRDRWWQMYDREPLDTWVSGRMALVGDAAHPMLQYLAQGACQAIEDADSLAAAVAAHAGDDDGAAGGVAWDGALADYQADRTARTARVQRTARSWGELWHCEGVFASVRNAMLRDRDPYDYRYLDWLYGA